MTSVSGLDQVLQSWTHTVNDVVYVCLSRPLQLFHTVLDGYNSVSSSCLSLLRASGPGWFSPDTRSPMTIPSGTFSSLVFHTSFSVLHLMLLCLIISVLLRNYRRARAELYCVAVDLQDYEMVELFLRRLKMWMGLSSAKEVHVTFAWNNHVKIVLFKNKFAFFLFFCP